MTTNSAIFEKYTLDAPAIKQSIKHLLSMAGFEAEEVLQVIIQRGQVTIIKGEKG